MKKILIADDSPFIRKALKAVITQRFAKEFRIVQADTGPKIVQSFKKEKPDLVFLDIVMPNGEEEGVKVLQQLHRLAANTPVVMITAVSHQAMMEHCKELGAVGYVVKPFDDDEIADLVGKYLR
jgi:two-component system, chemotaxis family, chemotaxis protein CheY